MTRDRIAEMVSHYEGRYGKPLHDTMAINKLIEVYSNLMDTPNTSEEIKQGIAEYYRVLQQRDLPAYVWLMESFHVTAKKSPEKRNFNYVVGMIRQWLKWGFGHIPSHEESDVVEYFEEVINEEVTPEARAVIQNLMATYGAIKVARMIGRIEREVNMPHIKSLLLKDLMAEKFEGDTTGK